MRYFIEVSYKGTQYAGFQVQKNANTIQAEVERVLKIFLKTDVKLTGSSRTDAGVHALQNFFQADIDAALPARVMYNLNALLPFDISVNAIHTVSDDAHARFDAISREYEYFIYSSKNPFLFDTAWYYPYTIEFDALQSAAQEVLVHTDFTSFAKRNSQVHTYNCSLTHSEWKLKDDKLVYNVKSNRFLRGMVRGLVGTMLQVGRGAISLAEFKEIVEARDCRKANFSTPAHGLFLKAVEYPAALFSSHNACEE
jgi:tRNA pseudouridine38-40 synthase